MLVPFGTASRMTNIQNVTIYNIQNEILQLVNFGDIMSIANIL